MHVPDRAADPEPRSGWLGRPTSERCSRSRASSGSLAALLVGGAAEPSVGALPVFVLVSLSLVVGLSTAASP